MPFLVELEGAFFMADEILSVNIKPNPNTLHINYSYRYGERNAGITYADTEGGREAFKRDYNNVVEIIRKQDKA
jgi:hypothetical protein